MFEPLLTAMPCAAEFAGTLEDAASEFALGVVVFCAEVVAVCAAAPVVAAVVLGEGDAAGVAELPEAEEEAEAEAARVHCTFTSKPCPVIASLASRLMPRKSRPETAAVF